MSATHTPAEDWALALVLTHGAATDAMIGALLHGRYPNGDDCPAKQLERGRRIARQLLDRGVLEQLEHRPGHGYRYQRPQPACAAA